MLDRNSFIADQRRVRRVFNSKLAIATAALIAVLAPSIYLVHRFQLAKVNRLLRQRSQDFREQSDYPNAIRYLDRYLRQRPDDLEAKIELAELMDKCAITIPEIESAIALQFTAIGLCDSSPELYSRLPKLRQRLIERLVEIGRFEDAMREIEPRIEKDPQPDLLRIIARCRMGLALEKRIDPYKTNTPFGKPEWYRSAISRDPVDLLLEALDANPGDFELNRLLAEVILNRSSLLNPSKLAALNAEDTQRLVWNSGLQMLATNPSSSDACALFLDIAATVDPDAAPPHFENALERFPDVAQIERAAGMFFLSRVTTDSRSELSSEDDELLSRAEAILKKLANQKRSQDARVFAALGDIYSRRGNKDEAIRIWNLGCTTCQPPTLELHFRIAQSNLQGAAGDITFQSLNQLDRAIQRESISITPKRHREMIRGSKELWIRYYQANRDSAAIESLLSALASSTASEDSETRSETSEFIAFNYLRSKKWGKASIAFQQALAYKPGDARLLRGAAQASLRSNHLPDAIAYLQLIDDKTLDDWFFLASAILDAHLRQNGSSNPFPLHSDLGSALDALDHAKQLQSHDSTKGPEGWRLRLLEIELAICRANREERDLVLQSSTEEIVAMCEGAPGIQELWQSSIWVLRRWGQQEPLNRLMELFASNHPDHELAILKRAEIAADRGAQSEGRTMLFDALQRNLSSELLSRTYFRFCDDSDKWPEEMQQLVDACGNDTDRIVAIGDMAIRVPVVSKANWDRAIRSVEDRLKRIEGTDGIAWRIVSAKRILAITNLEPTTDLAPAREIASFLIAKSPSLGAGYAISGAVADRGNQTTEAMYQYQKAVALGENDFSIHERLCELLYQNGRLDEAKALIDRMGVNRDASPRVASIALEMANDQPDRLLEIARSGIRTRPKDPMAWVWYASVLESESRDRTDEERADLILEATGAIDKGVAIAPADLRVINADFNFSSMTKQIDRLPKIMARLRIADSVPPLQKYIALGRMEFVSGDIEASIANYRSALEIGGDPIELTILIAKSQQRQRKFAEAIESLEVVYPKAPEHEGLRHMLASALASRGTPADWERIPSMLTSPPFGNNPSDLKLLANLHTQRGFASDLTIAKMLLERLIPKPERATGEELFQLGMVSLRAANLQLEANNQSEANWLRSEAEKYLRQSISQDPSNRDFRYVYGTLLLELHREAMALEQARQLRQIDRDGFEANLLLARALHATGDNQGGIGLMSQWLQGEMGRYSDPRFTTQRLASMGRGAVGFMMLGAKDRTESLLKEMDESSPSSSFAILATLLGVEDISLRSKALQLLLAYGTSVGLESPLAIEIGTVIARSLVGKKLDEDAKKTGEAFLRDMQTRHPEQLELQRAVSDYWLLQNETEIAVECLRRVVKLTPNDPVVLNNLACLLGESVGGCAEGLQYIERAIELVGEVPDLLDSKGTILMRMGQLEEAGKIFEKAAETGGDPRIVLHWYLALKRANKVEEANRVRERIDRERLRRVPLNREEQQELAALK